MDSQHHAASTQTTTGRSYIKRYLSQAKSSQWGLATCGPKANLVALGASGASFTKSPARSHEFCDFRTYFSLSVAARYRPSAGTLRIIWRSGSWDTQGLTTREFARYRHQSAWVAGHTCLELWQWRCLQLGIL